MDTMNKQTSEDIDEDEELQNEIERQKEDISYENAIQGDVMEFSNKIFEGAKKTMDKTTEKHTEECYEIIEMILKYSHLISNPLKREQLVFDCLPYKNMEIIDNLESMYFVLISGRYKVARSLIRKWLELVVVSTYYDTKSRGAEDEEYKKKFIKSINIIKSEKNKKSKDLTFYDKLKKVSDSHSLVIG